MSLTDDRTSHMNMPLPFIDNDLSDDVARLRSCLNSIDSKFQALDTLLGSDDATLDTVQEIVNAIKSDHTTITSILANKTDYTEFSTLSEAVSGHVGSGGTAHAAATVSANGFMSSADKSKLDEVSLGILFDEIEITPTAGQTSFVISGGYTAGCIQVFVNGFKLKAADFTATNGTDVVLGSGLTTSDELTIVRFKRGLAA